MRELTTHDRLKTAVFGCVVATLGSYIALFEFMTTTDNGTFNRWIIFSFAMFFIGIYIVRCAFKPPVDFYVPPKEVWRIKTYWVGIAIVVGGGILLIQWFNGGSYVILTATVALLIFAQMLMLRVRSTLQNRWNEIQQDAKNL